MEKDTASWLDGHIAAARKLIEGHLVPMFRLHGMPGVEREVQQAVYALNRALHDVAPALKAAASATTTETKPPETP